MSSTSAIIFIKCRNRQHMKNNIRYKGNTTSTSVIIFLKKSKTPSDVTLLGRNSSEVFVLLVVVSSFVDVLHFAVVLLISFSTSPLTLPWTIAGGFSPHFILSAQPIAEWFATLSFFDHSILPRALRLWVGIFFPTGVFYLMLLHRHFNLRLSRFPWEPVVLPWSLQGFIPILETQTRRICLFDSQ